MNYQDSSGKAQKEKTVWEGIAVSHTSLMLGWARSEARCIAEWTDHCSRCLIKIRTSSYLGVMIVFFYSVDFFPYSNTQFRTKTSFM